MYMNKQTLAHRVRCQKVIDNVWQNNKQLPGVRNNLQKKYIIFPVFKTCTGFLYSTHMHLKYT